MQDMLLGRLQGAAPTQLEQRLEVVGSTGRANPDTAATIKGVSAPTFDPRRFTFWGEGFGSWGRMSSDGNAAGVSTSTGGFVLGAEAKLDETYTIGVAGGFTRTVFDVDGRMSSGSDETTFAAVYGSANWGAVNLRLGALYAWHDIDTTRRISFPGFADEASASYSGTALMAFGEIGYRFELGSVQIEPFVGASVMRLQTGDFTESGGAAALTHHGRAYDLGATTLGVRTEVRIGEDLPLKFKGMIGWRRAFGDIRPAALVAFSGGVSGFSVSGTPIDRNTLVAEAGLDWQINKDITLGVLYSGQIGSRAQDHAVKGNFTWRF
jgi:outer membrane autotransporter protein